MTKTPVTNMAASVLARLGNLAWTSGVHVRKLVTVWECLKRMEF